MNLLNVYYTVGICCLELKHEKNAAKPDYNLNCCQGSSDYSQLLFYFSNTEVVETH